ncbi:MAG: protein kinase [Vicinamibacterales bacterium]
MPETVAHYTLLERLGVGTLGSLHRARDSKTGRTVALRLVDGPLASDAQRLQELESALRRASMLSHPNVAMVYDVGVHDGTLFYAQEFVPGALLTRLIADLPLNPRRAIGYGIEIADALAELEASGLRHGRLDPAAVIITPKGRAKLLDAGFAEWSGAAVAPTATDMVSLGRLLARTIAGPPPTSSGAMPAALVPVLDKCLSGGYESAALGAAALREVADSLESRLVVAAPGGAETGAPSVVKWAAFLVLVLGGAAILWLAVRG